MTTLPPLDFPNWLPPAVLQQAKNIYDRATKENEPSIAIDLLRRLTADPRMEKVWGQLSKKKRISHQSIEEFVHPATFSFASRAKSLRLRASELHRKGGDVNESEAKLIESEATALEHLPEIPIDPLWTEQDLAIGYFFHHAFYYVRSAPIVFISELNASIQTLCTAAQTLGEQAEQLRSLGMENDALELERIASNCEEQTYEIEPDESDPGIMDRRRGDILVRGYVAWIAHTSRQLFGTALYGTLATITNVAFDRNDFIDAQIREMLRAIRDPGVKAPEKVR